MPANKYSDSLLMDALRGSLSNAESLGRGFAVAPVGLLGDVEGLLRKGVNLSFGRGGVNVGETPVLPTTEGLLSALPRVSAPRRESSGMEQMGAAMNPRGPVNLGRAVASLPSDVARAGREFLAAGQPARVVASKLDLNKGIYKPELTMEEMLKVRDIPTVDRVKQSIDLVGKDQFQKMVDAQYKKYKPFNQDQEAMLVESVTLDILGRAQRSPYPQEQALKLAQQRAALPIEQGGLGLLADNTAMDRAKALGYPMGKFTFEPSYEKGHSAIGIFNRFMDQPKTPLKNAEKIKAEFEQMGIPVTAEQAGTGTVYLKFPSNPYSVAPEYGGGQSVPIETLRFSTHSKREFGKPTNKPDLDSFVADVFPKGGNTLDEARKAINELIKQGGIRSRFAAFDPFRKDVATATAMGVALPDLLAAEYNQQPQSAGLLYPLP